MGRSYVSAKAALLLLAACTPEPIPGPEISIVAHQLERCKLPDEQAQLELNALGDFDASERTSDFVTSDQAGAALAFPPDTLAVSAALSFPRSSQRFSAVGPHHDGDELPLLLWPNGRACELADPAEYPAPGGGQGLGYSSELSLVLLAGSDKGQSSAVSGALLFDTGTGAAVSLAGSAQLWRPRAFATVTEFGPGFLVAGGEDPTISFTTGRRLHDTAEVFVADEFAFDPSQELTLLEPRSRHAAIRLSATETLLIGGRTAADHGEAFATPNLELVDHATGYTQFVGQLTRTRVGPRALLLDDGAIFVAGGVDDDDELVPGADWIVRTAEGNLQVTASDTPAFAPRFDQDFVALPGGAVLAVGGCEDRAGSDDECAPCRRGCPPEAGWDAFWISKDRHVVGLSLMAPAPRPRLVPAPDGAPYLVPEAGSAGFEAGDTLLRFDPWDQVFRPVTPVDHPPELDLPLTGLDAGAAVWVTDAIADAALVGQRFSTRNEFAQDLELITLVSSTNSRWPLHLAPGQGAAPEATRYARLVPGEGDAYVLELADGAAVWLTDARFADFSLQVMLEQGEAPGLLVDSLPQDCHWPAPSSERPLLLSARRTGTRLELTVEAEKRTCDVPATRVALGFRGPEAAARLSRLSIRRDTH